jgi:phenylacetate-CoA ligase
VQFLGVGEAALNLARVIGATRADFEAAQRYLTCWPTRSGEDIGAMQIRRLAAAWSDAVSDVPYYRDLVTAGKAPAAITSWADFEAIPVLDRATVRNDEHAFIRLSGRPHHFVQTAGSTGNPIHLGVGRHEGRPQRIVKQAAWIRCGYELGSNMLLIWGHSHLLGTGWRRWINHAQRFAKDWCLGYHRANAYTLGSNDCDRIARWIVRARPAGIIGYASALDLFAHRAERWREALSTAGVRFVITTAEQPPRTDSLARLRDLFGGCTMVEEFGGVEFGQLGVRFDEDAWHTFPDLNVLEATPSPEDADGQSLLVTTLYPRYTPLFRYKQGDLVSGVRRLEHGALIGFDRLVGRAADMILMPDRRSVHSVAFFHCVHQEPAVLNVQMILADDGPRLKLVVSREPDDQFERRVRHRLKQVHPMLEMAPLEYVQDLATNAAGKRRWIIDMRTH